MRSSLKPLAGRRVRFAARFGHVSIGGNILLRDLEGPGGIERHMWIPGNRWPGKLMLPDAEIWFSARVGAYNRQRGGWDFGLLDIEIEGARP